MENVFSHILITVSQSTTNKMQINQEIICFQSDSLTCDVIFGKMQFVRVSEIWGNISLQLHIDRIEQFTKLTSCLHVMHILLHETSN